MKVKVCSKCQKTRHIDMFALRKRSKSGKERTKSWCRECSYAYRREYYANSPKQKDQLKASNKQQKATISAYLETIKNKPCIDCGRKYPHYVMDFDHRERSTKVENVGTMRRNGVSLETLRAEIEKCDLVCANCHRIRTHRKKEGPDVYSSLM